MLGLTLREEFRGKRLKGTAIELSNDTKVIAERVSMRVWGVETNNQVQREKKIW